MVEPRPGSLYRRIAANALSGAGSRLGMMVIGVGLTPFIVHALGLQMFGLWAVTAALAGYFGLLDFGLGTAFVKFIAEYLEHGRKDAARQVISFGMLLYGTFGLACAVPVFFLAPYLVHLFKMPAGEFDAAVHLFQVLYVILVGTMVLGLPAAVIVSMQRMDLASRNSFIGYLCYAVATVVLLRRGYGVWGVVTAQAVMVVATACLQYATARRLFGPLWHDPTKFQRDVIVRLFRFGGWTQLNTLLTILSLDLGRLITAGIVGLASVGYYEIGGKLAYLGRSLPSNLLDAVMPAAASAAARGDDDALQRLYRTGTVYSMFAAIGIIGFFAGANDVIVQVWMGRPYPPVANVVLWLGIGYIISTLAGAGTIILRASGLPRYETYSAAVNAAGTAVATSALVWPFGIAGVALGSALGSAVASAYFLRTFHRIHRWPWWPTVGFSVVRLAFAGAAAAFALSVASHAGLAEHVFSRRAQGLAGLVVLGVAYAVLYAGIAWLSGAFRADAARIVTIIAQRRASISAMLGRGETNRAA